MTKKLKITFVLPGRGDFPVGGPKVVYEYANHLSRKGHLVSVVHPARSCMRTIGLAGKVMNWVRYFQILLGKPFRPDRWFKVDPNVNLMCVPSLSAKWLPDADAVIATAWKTVDWVCSYPASKGRGFYFIQHFESWDATDEEVTATWKAPLNKIVIAKWLLNIAKGLGEDAAYIPNGLNADEFQMDVAPTERDPKSVMMLFHDAEWKGSAQGIEAIMAVKRQEPETKATLFGVPPRPASLPEWIDYYQQPSRTQLRALYNQAAIFMAPSWAEGWPLPPAEAMLSGAALVATDICGHQEYAYHENTALLSPAKDPQGLANNILRLIHDPAMRICLARQGHDYIQQFTWERATDSFETALLAENTQKG